MANSEETGNTANQNSSRCPTPLAHKTLRDAHLLWLQAERAYDDPESFRTYLNSCVQILRNVTWHLQKNKSNIPNFDKWYSQWQAKMKSDPILLWLKNARNRVVKQGDLEAKSTAKVSIVAGYLKPPYVEFEVPPMTSVEAIAEMTVVKNVPPHVRENGFMGIERRWVSSDLPDHELLDALAHAYDVLSALVDDAHSQAGFSAHETCSGHMTGPLPCMIARPEGHTAWCKLSTGEFYEFATIAKPIQSDDIEKLRSRYGKIFTLDDDLLKTKNFRKLCIHLFENAKHLFLIDGFHVSICILLLPDGHILPIPINTEDRAEKYLMWQHLAKRVEMVGANRILAIGEAWHSPFDREHPKVFAADSPDRSEVLFLCAASSAGEEISMFSDIIRQSGSLRLGQTQEMTGAMFEFLEPIRHIWIKWKKSKTRKTDGKRSVKEVVDASSAAQEQDLKIAKELKPLVAPWIDNPKLSCPCGSGNSFSDCCQPVIADPDKEQPEKKGRMERTCRAKLSEYIGFVYEHTVLIHRVGPPHLLQPLVITDTAAIVDYANRLALCLRKQHREKEILPFLAHLKKLVPISVLKEGVLSLEVAWLGFVFGKTQEARGLLETIPDILEIEYAPLAEAYLNFFAGMPNSEALKIVNRIIEVRQNWPMPCDAELLHYGTMKAMLTYVSGNKDEAIRVIDRACSTYLKPVELQTDIYSMQICGAAYDTRWRFKKNRDDFVKAEEIYKKALLTENLAAVGRAEFHFRLAKLYLDDESYEQAIQHFQTSIKHAKSQASCIHLAEACIQTEKFHKAEKIISELANEPIEERLRLDYLGTLALLCLRQKDAVRVPQVLIDLRALELPDMHFHNVRNEWCEELQEFITGKDEDTHTSVDD